MRYIKITSGSVTGYVKADYVSDRRRGEALAKRGGQACGDRHGRQPSVSETDATTDANVLGLIGEGEELTVTTSRRLVKVSPSRKGDGCGSTDYVDLRTDFVAGGSKGGRGSPSGEGGRGAKEEGKKKAAEVEAQEKLFHRGVHQAVVGSGSGNSTGKLSSLHQFVGNPYVYGGTSLTNGHRLLRLRHGRLRELRRSLPIPPAP